jgi:diguanylate cyclase (GGDEF)-like protein
MGSVVRLDNDRARADGQAQPGRGMARSDVMFVAAVVGASVLSSVLITVMIVGLLIEAIIPAVVIPTVVSVPASLYSVRQRLKIEALNAQLEELLRRDQLTGVLTRRYFLGAVQGPPTRPGALLVIDVDKFKLVNDTWGHPAGDRVLTEIAGRIGRAAGPGILVGRLGGEEFAVFAPGLAEAEGAALAEALRQDVAALPVLYEGTPIRCTISIGLALVPAGADSFDTYMRLADRALYAAKRKGRDQVCLAASPREVRA